MPSLDALQGREAFQAVTLLMLDVDGTLLNTPHDRRLPPETGPVLQRAMARGILVGLASGRNYGHLQGQMGGLGLNGPFVCNNGATVVSQGALLHETSLPEPALRFAFALAQAEGCLVEFASTHRLFIYRAPSYGGPAFAAADKGDYLTLLDGSPASFAQALAQPVAKLTFGVDSPAKARRVREALAAWNQAAPQPLAVTSSFWFAIEAMAQGVSKGRGLQIALDRLGIPPAQVMAIGDGDNDVELLQTAGVSFAMGNGSPAAKAAARYLAPGVEQNGAVAVIRQYLLGE